MKQHSCCRARCHSAAAALLAAALPLRCCLACQLCVHAAGQACADPCPVHAPHFPRTSPKQARPTPPPSATSAAATWMRLCASGPRPPRGARARHRRSTRWRCGAGRRRVAGWIAAPLLRLHTFSPAPRQPLRAPPAALCHSASTPALPHRSCWRRRWCRCPLPPSVAPTLASSHVPAYHPSSLAGAAGEGGGAGRGRGPPRRLARALRPDRALRRAAGG